MSKKHIFVGLLIVTAIAIPVIIYNRPIPQPSPTQALKSELARVFGRECDLVRVNLPPSADLRLGIILAHKENGKPFRVDDIDEALFDSISSAPGETQITAVYRNAIGGSILSKFLSSDTNFDEDSEIVITIDELQVVTGNPKDEDELEKALKLAEGAMEQQVLDNPPYIVKRLYRGRVTVKITSNNEAISNAETTVKGIDVKLGTAVGGRQDTVLTWKDPITFAYEVDRLQYGFYGTMTGGELKDDVESVELVEPDGVDAETERWDIVKPTT